METEISGNDKKTGLKKNQVIRNIEIEKNAQKGMGMCFFEGNTIFVYKATVGDIVNVKIVHKKKGIYVGEITDYIKTSVNHKNQTCDVFLDCGGCDWNNLDYFYQLKLKQDLIRGLFNQTNPEKIRKIIPSPMQEKYRNKCFLPVSQVNNKPLIGMYRKRTHDVVEHQTCYIQPDICKDISTIFKKFINSNNMAIYDEKTGSGNIKFIGFRIGKLKKNISTENYRVIVVIVTKKTKLPSSNKLVAEITSIYPEVIGIVQNINPDDDNVILKEREKILYGSSYLTEQMDKLKFRFHYSSFAQINTSQSENLYSYLKGKVPVKSRIIDAYSGTGTIGIFCSDKAEKVYCIESSESSHKDAISNAKINNIKNCEFLQGDVENEITSILKKERIDLIILDPPRKGVNEKILKAVADSRISQIFYVSCDPVTQKRDSDSLLAKNFFISEIQPFDMFPQTYHTENVVIFKNRDFFVD